MPTKRPTKRTAQITPAAGTKRRAAIEKRPRASILITGGTGFLGSHLVRQFIDDGVKDVRVMATSIPDWLVDLGVETFEGSITKPDDVKRAVDGIGEVYHLAGKVSRDRADAREMYQIHVEGTRLLCDAAKAAGASAAALSGAGPSVIAFSSTQDPAIGEAMKHTFEERGLQARIFHLKISNHGAEVQIR